MLNDLPIYIGFSLVVTVVIEVLGSLILGVRKKKDILNVILVNVLTNPVVVISSFLVNIFGGLVLRNGVLLVLEVLVVIVEGLIYKKYLEFSKIKPFVLSGILNLVSWGLGVLINNMAF